MSNVQTLADYRSQTQRFIPEEAVGTFDIDAQIHRLEERRESLLPINEPTRSEIHKAVSHMKLAKAGYYELVPLEPLKWRNEQGQPTFALFDVTSSRRQFQFSLKDNRWSSSFEHVFDIEPDLPDDLRSCFADMEEHLRDRIRGIFGQVKNIEVSMSTTFMGYIPESVEAEIKKAQNSGLFSHIYLVMEAPNWVYKEKPIPVPQLDPLVVGFTNHELVLITTFDLTTVEESLLKEAFRPSS